MVVVRGQHDVSPSMPTGISGVSASTVTSPSVPVSSRARLPSPAMSLISYGPC